MPLVSVIMPAHNAARYIREAVTSALAQTLADIEVIVVDDGSNDGTAEIARTTAAADPRVRLVRQANGGASLARNTALALSRGEILALLDADDVWDPRFLEEQVAILRARPDVDIVTGNAYEMGGHWDGRPSRPYPDRRRLPDLSEIIADEESVFIMSVFRRSVYERLGGFDTALRTNEDYDYWLRAAAAGLRFARNDRPLGWYRRSRQSLSANDVRMIRGILYVFRTNRPSILDRPRELALLDRQVERFETELLAGEARAAIERGDHREAAARLAALHKRRPGMGIALARALACCAPTLLARVYRARRVRVEARRAHVRTAA